MMKNIFNTLLLVFFIFPCKIFTQSLPTFTPTPFPTTQCNNLMGNYSNQWRPSHGSPNVLDLGCGNKVVRLYSKNDNISTRKSEGIFIDLNNIGVTLDITKKYKIIVSYRYSLPSNPNRAINFDAYFANGMIEKSNNSCEEEVFPNVSDKMKILTFANGEFLDDTYTCQIKYKEQGQISPNKSYKYLWITSNLNNTLNLREYVDIDKIEMYYDNSSGPDPSGCNLPPPSSLTYLNLTETSVRLKWNQATGTGLWYDIRLRNLSTGILTFSNNYHYLEKDYSNLSPDTSYTFTVAHACTNNFENNNVKTINFRTPCSSDLIINSPVTITKNFQASNSISASSYINDDLFVNYKAGNQVLLLPGFNVKAADNSLFHAYIGNCSSDFYSSGLQNNVDSLDWKNEQQVLLNSNTDTFLDKKNQELNILNSNIDIHPNPTSTFVNINTGSEKIISWQLFDISGKSVLNGASNQVNVQGLPKAMYLLKINVNNKITTKKVIVE